MKDLVICFPSAQSSTVEMYMRNKGKALYERAYNLDDAVEMLNNAEKGDLHLHIFDFINEGCLYVPFVENSDKFEEVTVITTQKDVALKYKRVTSNVQLVTPLMDLLSLFWDSPVFNIANVEQCELNNTSVVHMKESKQEGSTIGKAVITIESEVIKEKHNKLGIINIGYKTKEDKIGNSLSNESYGVRDIVGTIGEVSTSVLKELFEVKEESEILKEAIKAKEEEDNLVDQIMEAKFASNINEYMLDMGVIDERKFNTLCQLDDEGKLGAPKEEKAGHTWSLFCLWK